MRRGYDHDGDLLTGEPVQNDLVLGAPALLSIFFAFAVICAVCFGFGYSSGHTYHITPKQQGNKTSSAPGPQLGGSAAEDATPTPAYVPPAPVTQATVSAPKPLPGATAPPVNDNAALPPARVSSTHITPLPPLQRDPSLPPAPPMPMRRSPVLAAGAATPAASAGDGASGIPAAATASLMVQIAAVTKAADAETLAEALQHDGFQAVVRTTTGDRFFHVQVGPFTSITAAKAMRARLADRGYNAFIRP